MYAILPSLRNRASGSRARGPARRPAPGAWKPGRWFGLGLAALAACGTAQKLPQAAASAGEGRAAAAPPPVDSVGQAAAEQARPGASARLLDAGGAAAPTAEAPARVVLAPGQVLEGEELVRLLRLSPLPPVPPDPTNAWAEDPDAAHLGQYLFFDPRLSADGTVSCATCHDPAQGWADGRPFGVGLERVERHTMSLWNVAYNRWFFWDGRADSLWSQALVPLEDPREHGGSRLQYAHLVHGDPELRAAYEAVFGPLPELGDPERFPPVGRPVPGEPEHPHQKAWDSMAPADREAVSELFANLGKAIAAFERRIVTGRSRFDEFVEGVRTGDPTLMRSLSADARRGLGLFLGKAKCHLCHHGPNFTDLEFHNTRVPPRAGGNPHDPGRYEGIDLVQRAEFRGTGPHSDAPGGDAKVKIDYLAQTGHNWGEFKTPSLRNVTLSPPYMHQGQFETLHEVLRHYSTLENAVPVHQHGETILVPLQLSEREIDDLVAFLGSLTAESLDPALTRQPASPRR